MKNSKTSRQARSALGMILVGIAASAPAFAQTAAPAASSPAQALLDARVVASGGAFMEATSVNAGLHSSTATNPAVDFDKTFGKDEHKARARLDLLWRITPTHRLAYEYFSGGKVRSKAIAGDVQWGDVTYQAGASVAADTRLTVNRLVYEYAFIRQPGLEVAAVAGVHQMDYRVTLDGTGSVSGGAGGGSQGRVTREARLNVPLPMVGISASKALSDNWVVEGQVKLLRLGVNGVDGSWSDVRLSATYMVNRNLGLGVAYDRFNSNIDSTKADFRGHVGLSYSGLQFFVTGAF